MLELFISSAAAQEGMANTQNPLTSFLPFILIFIIFYFLMLKPQKKKLQDEQTLLASLGKGDEIFTKSGLLGTITGMTEKIVTLEVTEGVKMKVLRSQVGGLAKSIFEKKEDSKKDSKKESKKEITK